MSINGFHIPLLKMFSKYEMRNSPEIKSESKNRITFYVYNLGGGRNHL